MVMGIGIDVVDTARITPLNIKLAQRVLTPYEFASLDQFANMEKQITFFGGRFAIKEAFSKAIGTGIGKLSFQDIEVVSDDLGKPMIVTNAVEAEKTTIHVSLSHTETTIVAVVIIEKK